MAHGGVESLRTLVTGGTGFVGAAVCRALQAAGHDVTVVSRRPEPGPFRAIDWEAMPALVGESDAVVHLAGEPIASGRWSRTRKMRILESRVQTTQAMVDALAAARVRPRVLVSASAVGYYGPHGDEVLDEAAPAGTGFLARVGQAWESEALRAEALGLRVVRLRLGIVLAPDGGALARMVPPFRAFIGGPLGSGKQWMSWIHRDDVTGLVVAALGDEHYRGAVNATAPHPVTNAQFAEALGRVLARPAWIRTPAFVLRLALGEMAEMLVTGQRVVPRVAEERGYRWRYTELAGALRASVRR
jgi:hypothetical protein